MRKSPKSSTAMLIALMLVVLTGLIHGCASREWFGEGQGASDPSAKFQPASEKDMQRFTSAIRRVDGSADAHYRLALYFQERYRHKLAIDELEKATQSDPGHVKAYNAMGVSFDNLGDHDTAIHYYHRALQIDPKLDYVYNNLGYSCLLKGDVPGAVDAFQQAIALNGSEKRYRNNLGLAYVKQEEYDLALEQFKVDDTDVNAVTKLAKVMLELGKPESGTTGMIAGRMKTPVQAAPPAAADQSNPRDSGTSEAIAAAAATDFNPVTRYQTLVGRMNRAEEPSVSPAAATPVVASVPAKMLEADEEAAPASGGVEEEAITAAQAETLTGPVIDIAAAPETNRKQPETMTVAAEAAGQAGRREAEPAAGKASPHYAVASVRLSPAPTKDPGPAVKHSPYESYQVQAVAKELREVAPPHIEEVASAHTEAEEERILIASSSIRAGGWQVAPEPRNTIEKTLGIIEIEVENGNGTKDAAAKVAKHLRNKGFMVVRVSDANSFDHLSTKVFYCSGNLKEVRRLLATMPEVANEAELYEMQTAGNGVRLLIGKDLVEKNRELSWIKPRTRSANVGG